MLHCQHHANLSTRAGPIRAKRQPPQIPATLNAALQMSCNSNHHILPEIPSKYPRVRCPTTPPKEKKLDDIGLYWSKMVDMSRPIPPKREDFGPIPDNRRASFTNTQILCPTTARTRLVLPGCERRNARSYTGNCLDTGNRPIETRSIHFPP